MKICRLKIFYYSATGSTRKIIKLLAEQIAGKLEIPLKEYDFTLPDARMKTYHMESTDLVLVGIPVYAGRIPNKMLPFVQNNLKGNGALAVPIVVFGNRNYDDALLELRNELNNNEFHTIAAAAFVARHVFSNKIAEGRPDASDLMKIKEFGDWISDKLAVLSDIPEPVKIGTNETVGNYYTPLGIDEKPAVFLKAKPKTDMTKCTGCGICAQVCPMGSISERDPSQVQGICIKCQACIRKCPENAKYFDHEAFLSHVTMLEQNYIRRAEPECFW